MQLYCVLYYVKFVFVWNANCQLGATDGENLFEFHENWFENKIVVMNY